jgi:glyoxylase-like metal-dependent hydrolase (beta-lactamase superfamily II)
MSSSRRLLREVIHQRIENAPQIGEGLLKVVHTPGPEHAHYAFWREQRSVVLFCPDLIMREENSDLAFIPAEYHDDPEATRESVQRLLNLPFEVLCMDHGAPITANPHGALRKLLGQGIARQQ